MRAATTKYHKLSKLNDKIYGVTVLEARIKALAGLSLLWAVRENPLCASPLASGGSVAISGVLGLSTYHPDLSFHVHISLCACVQISLLYKDTRHIELGFTLMTSS